jgi:2-oxoglutarate dehydrogenase E2 component (dihydrolipoamide succinyltransferase)
MPIDVKIPEVGESITEVQIAEWLKSEGDDVKGDENLAVIDSEKTTFELPAPKGGRITKILRKAGDTVKVGETIAQIQPDGEPGREKPEAKPEKEPQAKSQPETTQKPTAERPDTEKQTPKTRAKPVARKTEESNGQEEKPARREEPRDEPQPDGEQKAEDAKPSPAAAEPIRSTRPSGDRQEEIVPMTMLRRTVARRLVEARHAMAMLTTFNEVDMSAVQSLRKEHGEAFEQRYKIRLGFMSFFVKAAIEALKQFPALNAEIRDADIVYRKYFDIGVAIATERGLVVPVLRNAERSGFAELERHIADFASRARDSKLKPEELEGGTFTVTNGGVFGSLLSTPIINPPQSGILGMHTIQDRPVAVAGQVVIRPMMYVALTYDHRLVDGREAVLFLRRVKETIENPARILLEV